MIDPFADAAGWLHANLVVPALYEIGATEWEETAFTWTLLALYGIAQMAVAFAICTPFEHWRPVERWGDRRVVVTDIIYTLIARIGILPLFGFVLFQQIQVWINGSLTDIGWVPPNLERLFPWLLHWPTVTFLLYAVVLDLADYWRHRLQHTFGWWWALHSVHHSQKQMTFWTDDRNHVLDDLISMVWFGAVALLIGVPPEQFPLIVLLLRLLESFSHANVRLSFGRIGERLLVSPRFHRAHHGVLAAGERSVNFGVILPLWDVIFGTADFNRAVYPRTGDPNGPAAMATGGWWMQQWLGLRRMVRIMLRVRRKPKSNVMKPSR